MSGYLVHPHFDEALSAFDRDDLEGLRALIRADPSLVAARTNLDPPYHYFTGATLLHHVAGNPNRDGHPLPAHVIEFARLLLDAGADVHAETLGPNGGSTMGLLVTSKQASDRNLSGLLMDVLHAHGASLDLTQPDALDGSLANHAPRAAEKMIELGAQPDVIAHAALGRIHELRDDFDEHGQLRSPLTRKGRVLSNRDAVGLAALFAYVRGQQEAVAFLLERDGNWNMTGVNNGALLHRAAAVGDLPMVKRLVAKGADTSNRDNPFGATPLSWADHAEQRETFDWLRQNSRVDLHDAAGFGLTEHVHGRLRETPEAVNEHRTQWRLAQATPLHVAALMDHSEIARLLLAAGADPTLHAGNRQTPLEVAEQNNARNAAALLREHARL
jgi:hypothetical protein